MQISRPNIGRAPACNDNGACALFGRRSVGRNDVVMIASKACRRVLASYVTRGCMIIASADRKPIPVAA